MKLIRVINALIVSFGILALSSSLRAADPAAANATVYSVTGTAQFAPPLSTSFSPIKAGQVLPVGSSIRTGDDGKVVLQTSPGSSVELGPNSILKINELAFHKSGGAVTQLKARLELTSGVVSALVDPSTPKVTDFKIQTPDGALVARGTNYTVIVRDGKTYVQVDEGKVAAISKPSRRSI